MSINKRHPLDSVPKEADGETYDPQSPPNNVSYTPAPQVVGFCTSLQLSLAFGPDFFRPHSSQSACDIWLLLKNVSSLKAGARDIFTFLLYLSLLPGTTQAFKKWPSIDWVEWTRELDESVSEPFLISWVILVQFFNLYMPQLLQPKNQDNRCAMISGSSDLPINR